MAQMLDPMAAGGSPAPAPPGPTGPAAPAEAPAPAGLQIRARTQITVARKLLEMALVAFGSESEEGRAIVKALKPLSDAFTQVTPEGLGQTEMQTQAPAGPPGPGLSLGGPRPMPIAGY